MPIETNAFKTGAAAHKRRYNNISGYEMILYLTLPFLLVMCGAMPSSALFVLPAVLPMLYLLYRRFGPYMPIACICCYASVSLALNYDILTVIYAVALLSAFFGTVLSAQTSPYLAAAAVAVSFTVCGALAGVGIVRMAEGRPVESIVYGYIVEERDDPVIGYLSRKYYAEVKLPEHMEKLPQSDPGYGFAAAETFAKDTAEDSHYIWYECIHWGAVIAAVGFFAAVAVNRRTSDVNDSDGGADPGGKTRAKGGVSKPVISIADMRLPRSFLWCMALPATVAGMVLELVGGYPALSATFMHMFVTLPCAFACFTLFVFFASLFRGKARIAAYAVLTVIGIVTVVFPFAVFVLSMIGVSDCILNIRFWTKFIAED